MPLTAIGLVLGLLAGPPTLPPNTGGNVPGPPIVDDATTRVILRCAPADFAALSAELRVRWPGAELLEYGTEAFDRVGGRSFVYLEVTGERVGDAPMSITLITSDGRAYLRRVTPKDTERTRVLAIASANLLAAVADEDVPPDREQAVVPLPTAEVPDAPPAEPDAPPTDVDPTPTKPPPLPRTEPDPPRQRPRPLPAERDVWQLAINPGATVGFGLAPQARRGQASFGGDLRLDVRAPIGLAFGGGLRVLLDGASDYRLVRIRVVPGVGWVGRAERLEWAVIVGPSFEPWRVLRDGRKRSLGSYAGDGYSMLYGGAVHGALGYRVRLRSAQPSALRIGVHFDLAASAMGSGSVARVRDSLENPALFALGGLELGLGIDLGLWFDLGPPSRRRPSPKR